MYNEARSYSYGTMCKEFSEKYSRLLDKNVVWEIVGYEKYSTIRTGILLELPKAAKNTQSTILLARYLMVHWNLTNVIVLGMMTDAVMIVQIFAVAIVIVAIGECTGLTI